MSRTPQACHQCGREIYFDGLCIQCRAVNERNEILAYSQLEIEAKIEEICEEIKTLHDLKEKSNIFKKLVNYRDINTGEIARTAFANNVFYPMELYKDASDDIINAMIAVLQKDDIGELNAQDILLCLATHGGQAVLAAFGELEKNHESGEKSCMSIPLFMRHMVAGPMIKTEHISKRNITNAIQS